jgi:hypothetical protein
MGSPVLLEAEELRDLVPDRDGDDEAGEQEEAEDPPEAPARHSGRAVVLELRMALGAVEAVRPVDRIWVEWRRPCMPTAALHRLGHYDKV